MGHHKCKVTVSGQVRMICATATRIALVTSQGLIHVLDVGSRFLQTLDVGQPTIASDAVVTSGDILFIGDKSGTISVWNLAEGKRQAAWSLHPEPLASLCFVGNSNSFLACSYIDGMIQVIDVYTGLSTKSFHGQGPSVASLFYSSVSNTLVSASYETGLRFWNADTGDCKAVIKISVQHVQWTTDHQRLATASPNDLYLCLWNVSDGSLMTKLTPPSSARGTLSMEPYTPAGYNGLISTHEDGSIRVWDCDNQVQLYAFDSGKCRSGFLRALMTNVYSGPQDVHRVVTAHRQGVLKVWRIPAPLSEQPYNKHQYPENLPRPRGEELVGYDEDESRSCGVVFPLVILGNSTECVIGAAVSKTIIENDNTTPIFETDFHLIHFDPASW